MPNDRESANDDPGGDALRDVLAAYRMRPEVVEKQALLDVLRETRWESNMSETVQLVIPFALRHLWNFLERITVANEPGHRESFHNFLAASIDRQFSLMLIFLETEDSRWSHFRDTWNRVCDERGHPELKRDSPDDADTPGLHDMLV